MKVLDKQCVACNGLPRLHPTVLHRVVPESWKYLITITVAIMLHSLLRDTTLQTRSRADTLKPSFAVSIVIHVVQVEPVIGERPQYEAIVVTEA